MDLLTIKPTHNSLEVSLDPESGTLLFAGRSYPENSIGFFKPIMDWVEAYTQNPASKTEFTCKLEYVNSASRKCLVDIFRVLEAIYKSDKEVVIIWCSDEGDDTMREMGEEYENMFKMKFVFEQM